MPSFMFTDIQGSTRKCQLHPEAMSDALARHDILVRREVELSGGRVVKHTGDGLEMRIGVHSGDAIESGDDCFENIPVGALLKDAGNAAHLQNRLENTLDLWTRALSLSRGYGLEQPATSLLCNIASVRKRRGELSAARELLEEASALSSNSGNPNMRASVLSNIADILTTGGDVTGARKNHVLSLALRMEMGDLGGISFTLEKLSRIAEVRSPREALELARESLCCAGEGGGNRSVYALVQLSRALALIGEAEEALKTLSDAEKQAARLDLPSLTGHCREARTFIEETSGGEHGP